jgi:hypothetical protein
LAGWFILPLPRSGPHALRRTFYDSARISIKA